ISGSCPPFLLRRFPSRCGVRPEESIRFRDQLLASCKDHMLPSLRLVTLKPVPGHPGKTFMDSAVRRRSSAITPNGTPLLNGMEFASTRAPAAKAVCRMSDPKTILEATLTVVLAGGDGKRLLPLTAERPKPAVPIAGPFKLIDFTLSNCFNSGLRRLFLLTQYKSEPLHCYIRDGWSALWNR